MDISQIEPSQVLTVYVILETTKWLVNKMVSDREQFKILASISKSQEAVAVSFNHVAAILENILTKMSK